MDTSGKLSALQAKAKEQLPLLDSKRKQENALVLPFFAALGYWPFDIEEVEPEFAVEVGEGEERTVDYAVKKGGAPAILFQVEETGADLEERDSAPLLRALEASAAPAAALTDGIQYHFFADLERFYAALKARATDDRDPFLTFHLLSYSEGKAERLRRLSKPALEAEEILSFAHYLKSSRRFRKYLQRQRESPEEAFVRFIMERVHGGEAPKGDPGMYEAPLREALRQVAKSSEEGRGHGPPEEDPPSSMQKKSMQKKEQAQEESGQGKQGGPGPIDTASGEESREEAAKGPLEEAGKGPEEESGDAEGTSQEEERSSEEKLSMEERFRKFLREKREE